MSSASKRRTIVGLLALCLLPALASPIQAAPSRPEVGPQVQAYTGAEGVKVWLARVGPRTADEALVQIGGIDHDWNMTIQKMARQEVNGQQRYSVSLGGRKFVALILHGEGRGALYLPGSSRERPVWYSEELSAQGNPEAFLTDYLKQSKTAR